jgi:hypothetical protein
MITRGYAVATVEAPTVEYYDLKKNWQKVKPHIANPEVQEIMVRDFNKFTWGKWRKEFKPGHVPTEFENSDWRWMRPRPQPEFWNYTKSAASLWLVNFSLRLAQLVEPDREWRIITSHFHSTVWDGKHVLFDFEYQAMRIPAKQCFATAHIKELKPGEFLQVYFAEHYWKGHARTGVGSLAASIVPLEALATSAEEQELIATIKANHSGGLKARRAPTERSPRLL